MGEKESKKELIERIMKRWGEFKETAEQYMFPLILVTDVRIEAMYKKLNEDWTDEKADAFIEVVNGLVFKKLGIAV